MSLYTEISQIIPYLQSIRKIEKYLSIDVLFPEKWKLPKVYVDESKVIEQKTSSTGVRSFSFVSELNSEIFSEVKNNIVNIIEYNLEREEKDKLFKEKVNALKQVFENESLNNLQNLIFDIKTESGVEEYSLDKDNYNEDEKDLRMVSEGVEEG